MTYLMLSDGNAKPASQRPVSRFRPTRMAPAFASPGPFFPLVSVDICKGPRLFRLFFSGNGGHRQRATGEFTKLIYLARFLNFDS